MKRPTENQTLVLCALLAAVGALLRFSQIAAGDWPHF